MAEHAPQFRRRLEAGAPLKLKTVTLFGGWIERNPSSGQRSRPDFIDLDGIIS